MSASCPTAIDGLLNADYLATALKDLTDAPHWYVGFSGGVDSTALLHMLVTWRQAQSSLPPITAIHVNHGMQSQAGEWQAHCQRQCDHWRVPILLRDADLATSGVGEAQARTARYAIFREVLAAGEVLLLAHHLDDQVETFFLRLLRGAGPEGLSGMPPRRAIGQATLVRPLLQMPRSEVEAYAHSNRLDYVQDPSNADTSIDRNFLRQELLPRIAERWPGHQQTVSRAAELMRTTTDLLRGSLGVPLTVYNCMNDPGLELDPLLADGEDAAAVRLRTWLQNISLQPPDKAVLEEFLRQLGAAAPDANPRLACSAYGLQRFRGAVYVVPKACSPVASELRPGEILEIPGVGQLALEANSRQGLYLQQGESLQIAWRSGGERLRLRGAGHSTSLKQILQERGVPPWWRDLVPLVYLDGDLIYVGDLASAESGRWREQATDSDQLWNLVWQRPAEVLPQ